MVRTWLQSRGGRIAAAVSSGVVARALSSFIAFVSLPLAVRYLGPERYGVWATVTSTVIFLNLLDLGIAATLTNHIARSFALSDKHDAAKYTTNAIVLAMLVAALAAAVLSAIWPHIDWVSLFNVSGAIPRAEVSATVAAAVALVLLGLPASLTGRIFAGYQEVHRYNLITAAAAVANLLGLIAGMTLRVSMPVLLAMATGWITLLNLCALAALLLWTKAWLRPCAAHLGFGAAGELLSSGSGFFLIQIAGAVVFSSDNLVLSHYLGPVQVTPYSVTWRLVGLSAALQSLFFPALWPAYAEAYARGDHSWMQRTFRLTMRGTFAVNTAFAVALVVFGQPLIRWWAGAPAVPSRLLLAAMALWAVISGCMTAESCLLAAVNRTREQGVLSIVAAAVNLALSVYLVQRVAALGVIAGTILSYLLVLVVPQTLLVRSVLRTSGEPPGGCVVEQRRAVASQ